MHRPAILIVETDHEKRGNVAVKVRYIAAVIDTGITQEDVQAMVQEITLWYITKAVRDKLYQGNDVHGTDSDMYSWTEHQI